MDNLTLTTTTTIIASFTVLAAVAIANAMGLFGSKNNFPIDGKTVLLTGGSEGMGRSVARLLAQRGANIILVARNAQKLAAVVAELKTLAKSPSQRFHAIPTDVSDPAHAGPLLAAATAWNGDVPPDVLWCVAGVAHPTLFADTADAVSIARRAMDVNYWGSFSLSHAVLRAWYSPSLPSPGPFSPPRHVVFTATTAVFAPVAGYALYAPSKAALRALADAVSQEALLYPDHPVRVHVVFPGTITSDAFAREQELKHPITKQLEKDDPVQTPDEVAAAAVAGLEGGKYFVTVNWLGELMRYGVLGSSWRNNWLVDSLGAFVAQIVWFFVLWDMRGAITAYGKKNGRPVGQLKQE